MPWFRFTLRQLMAIVAVAAFGAGAADWHERMKWLSIEYRWRGFSHCRSGSSTFPRQPLRLSERERWDDEMAAKWFRAARYPWLPVEPDPPPPPL